MKLIGRSKRQVTSLLRMTNHGEQRTKVIVVWNKRNPILTLHSYSHNKLPDMTELCLMTKRISLRITRFLGATLINIHSKGHTGMTRHKYDTLYII